MEANGSTKTTVKPGDVITGIGYQFADGQKMQHGFQFAARGVGITMLHEVPLTQKIIIVGVNQFI